MLLEKTPPSGASWRCAASAGWDDTVLGVTLFMLVSPWSLFHTPLIRFDLLFRTSSLSPNPWRKQIRWQGSDCAKMRYPATPPRIRAFQTTPNHVIYEG